MTKITKKTTNSNFKNIMDHMGMFFYMPHMDEDRTTGEQIEVNDLRFAQEAVLRSVANALFYQLKACTNYHERTMEVGRNMLNSTRQGPNMEDKFMEQRERILRAQTQVEVIRAAFQDAVRAYSEHTEKKWAEPDYKPRAQPAQSNAAADLAKLVGGDGAGHGDDMKYTTGDQRERVA